MPARNTLLRPAPTRATVQFGAETVNVVFDRNRITENWIRRITEDGADLGANSRGIAELLIEWDIFEDDAQTVRTPITAGVLADMPSDFMAGLVTAITEASAPSSAEGNDSSNILSTASTDSTPQPASLLNGQEPSVLPAPSESLSTR